MGDDLYPRFSQAEMARRREAVLETMGAAGVSHLVVYGADRSGTAVPWLTEWPTTQEAALLLSPGERPHLLVQHYNHITNDERAGVQTGHLVVVTADGHRPLHHVPCQVSVPGRHSGSGTCTTLVRGLGRGVDPVRFAAGVGERAVGLDRIVFHRVDSEQFPVL